MSALTEILTKLGEVEFKSWTVTTARISKKNFEQIFMDPFSEIPPVYESRRTVTEKWGDLQKLGFARLINKTVVDFNIDRVRDYLKMEGRL